MKFGARIFKTGIAVTLSLYIAMLLNLEPVTFAAVSAVFAVQPSVYRSFQTILDQFQANIIGAIVAIVFTLAFGNEPFVIGLGAILIIAISIKLKMEKTIPLAVVTLILIMESSTDGNFFLFALSRLGIIMIGVLSSFVVNLLFLPPKHETKLFQKIITNTEYVTQWLRLIIRHDAEHIALKDDIQKLREEMIDTNNFYKLYKEERDYFKKNEYTKGRKLVVFRQMITTTEKAIAVLKNLHFHEQSILDLPEEMKELLREQIDYLTQFHDRTLLKYSGKVRHEPSEEFLEEIDKGEKALTEQLIVYSEKKRLNQEDWTELFQTIGLIIGYKDQLKHLDLLIDSLYTYHPEETSQIDK
ncbi:aromatic acid exporter family protein [Pueribacillus sp. YX66]|uniref:FUSC family protein n=1 Tax=Pueribacillus sp. YX66 TaxID=3229242 RepID=UPI00358D2BC2